MNSLSETEQALYETAWEELGKIPVDDDGNLLENWGLWPPGTNRETIWRVFDRVYPGGVYALMFKDTSDKIGEEY